MDNFFYNLNDKLNAIRATPETQLNEGTVAEAGYSAKAARAGKDIGKPGKNFEKIAKDAGQRYGSKAAGERVAGAVLNKLRHPREDVEEAIRIMAKPEGSQVTRGTAAYVPKNSPAGQTPAGQAHRDATAAMAKAARAAGGKLAMNKTTDVTGKRVAGGYDALAKGVTPYRTNEGDMEEGNEFSGELAKAKAQHRDSFEVDGRTYPVKEEGGIPMTAKQKSFAALAPPKDKITFADKIAGAKQEVEEMLGDVAAEAMKNALVGGQKKLDRNKNGQLDANDFAMLRQGGKQETDEGEEFVPPLAIRRYMKANGIIDVDDAYGDLRVYGQRFLNSTDPFERAAAKAYFANPRPSEDDESEVDEGWDEMEKDVKRRMGARKVGDVTHGAKHDTEEIPGGRRVTRRTDPNTGYSVGADDDKPADSEKRGRGRPKSAPKGPERVTAKATKHKGGRKVKEGESEGSDLVKLAKVIQSCKTMDQLETARQMAQNFLRKHQTNDIAFYGPDMKRKMAAVSDIERKKKELQGGEELEEKAVSQQQQKFMGMAHAMQKGEKVKGASKELKKVAKTMTPKDVEDFAKTKHAGLPKKAAKKEESVEETTSSGSVATGGDAPKKSKGGVQIGKGIYDSINRELESMIAESMSVNVSMTNDDNGAHKNITVTAADEDAEALAQLLSRAGLTGGEAHSEPCPDCGSTDCGCDETVEEAYGDVTATKNKPDWPTDTEYSDDAMQYSGGLNKPKTTIAGDGQTTVPVTAVQVKEADAELARMIEMAGIDQGQLKPWERTMKEEAIEEAMPTADAQIDQKTTNQYAQKIIQVLDQNCGQGTFEPKYNQDGTITISKRRDQQWADEVYRQMGRNTNDPDLLKPGTLTAGNMNKAVSPYLDMFRQKGWRFDQPMSGQFTIGVTAQQPAVAEGVVDAVKGAVKKGLEKLGHGSDEEMIKDLQKKTGVPPTGKKPEDKKMEESLMAEFSNFKI